MARSDALLIGEDVKAWLDLADQAMESAGAG